MADQFDQFPTIEPLPPELEDLHRRLLEDGARWRARLPSTGRLEQHLNMLAQREYRTGLAAGAEEQREGRRGLRLLDRTKGDPFMLHGRVKTFTAALAIAAVVTLFVVLFHNFATGRSIQTGHSNTPPSSTSNIHAGPLTSYAGLTNLEGLPMIAPGDPQVVYLLKNDASGQLVLARTDDDGKSWQTFALPAGKSTDNEPPQIFVSPLNAQYVFLRVNGTRSGNTCEVSQASNSYAVLSGGGNLCSIQYLSIDGGAHWQVLQLPEPGALGDTSKLNLFNGGLIASNSLSVFRAQGTRLYSAIYRYPLTGEAIFPATARIVTSTDGGLTWTLADQGLASSDKGICDYAPDPASSTIFALTAPGCNYATPQPLTLWRSDDAGADWTKVGQLPSNGNLGMVVVSRGAGAEPLLYINMPQVTPAGQSQNFSDSPADIQVSADGGKTWQKAPTQGFPGPKHNPGAPLGVLSDGSLLFCGEFFYTWKAGDAAWHSLKLAAPETSTAYGFVTAPDANGSQTLWLVKFGATSNLTYSVQSSQLRE